MSDTLTKDEKADEILSSAMSSIQYKSSRKQSSSMSFIDEKSIEELFENSNWNRIDTYIKSVNDDILLNYLAPEVRENEKKKRDHKDKLITYVSVFLCSQFTVIFIILFTILCSIIYFHHCDNDLDYNIIKILFGFFGTYITSVIVELIFILKFIVEKVFDTSITSLMEIFKSKEEERKKQNNEEQNE